MFSWAVCNSFNSLEPHEFILNICWLDTKEIKVMVKDIVHKMDARDCLYLPHLIKIPYMSLHGHRGGCTSEAPTLAISV